MKQEEKAASRTTKKFHKMELNVLDGLNSAGGRPRAKARPGKGKGWKENDARFIGPRRAPRVAKNPDVMPQVKVAPPAVVNLIGEIDMKQNGVTLSPAADPGTQNAVRLKLGDKIAQCVFNGVADGDVRFPDPFSLVPTTITRIVTTTQLSSLTTSTSSTSANKFQQGIVGGDNTISMYITGTNQSTANFDWRALSSGGVLTPYAGGLNSADFLSRTIAIVADLQPLLVGPAHTITICAVPINPVTDAGLTLASPTGWPTAANLGISSVQASWGARIWTINSGEEGVRLVSLPADSRGLSFVPSNVERQSWATSSANCKWSQWLWWAYGMSDGDSIQLRVSVVQEVFPNTTSTTNYAYPKTERPSNARSFDNAVNTIERVAKAGYNAMRLISKNLDWKSLIGRATAMVSNLLGSNNSAFGIAGLPYEDATSRAVCKSDQNEEIIQRFLARNSQSSSSSSGDGRVLDTPRTTAVRKQ